MSKSDTPSVTIPPLAKGEIYAGIVVSKGVPQHHLILLPGETRASWKGALAWAKEKNAELPTRANWKAALALAKNKNGDLPTRVEQALLFANAADQFQQDWYWSAEPHAGDASCAWCQYFDDGRQGYDRQTNERRALAVRRVVI